jgi:hypothetical protein
MTRLPEKLITETIKRLIDDEIGWLEVIDAEGVVQNPAEGCGVVAVKCLEQKRTEQKEKKGSERVEYTEAFDEFWQAYPKRLNKRKAFQSWTEAIAQAGTEDIIQGAIDYAGYCKAQETEAKFVKHPSTWLNQGCWEDEYDNTTAPRKPTPQEIKERENNRIFDEILDSTVHVKDWGRFRSVTKDKYNGVNGIDGIITRAIKEAQEERRVAKEMIG